MQQEDRSDLSSKERKKDTSNVNLNFYFFEVYSDFFVAMRLFYLRKNGVKKLFVILHFGPRSGAHVRFK